ncbi:MAG TPA: RNA 2',3'-cyclic phosphodiesterase [Methanomassiliicoccales archaeon]|nr:RNA 2',3'-cyclic phosphodiesterase [Methanomassiliicoccales archaeon]
MTSLRAFVAVEVECAPTLQEALAELKAYGKALKPVSPANVHITLKFLGEIYERTVPDIEKVMRTAVQGVPPFDLHLVDVGVFPNERNPRVVWVGLDSTEPLTKMAAALEEGCEPLGFPRERRPFSPHLTLARVREGFRPDVSEFLRKHQGQDLGSFKVERIKLKKSVLTPAGPIYSDVLAVEL